LFLIDSDVIWFNSEALIVMLCILLISVLDRGLASFDTEPLTEVSAFCQRGGSGMGSARQPDQPDWRARSVVVQKLRIRRARYFYVEFFK